MPTLEVRVSPTELLRAAEQMSDAELEDFTTGLQTLRARRRAPHLPARESELLEKINVTWPPEWQARFDALVARRQAETITPKELAELIGMTDQTEMFAAERLQAVVELAGLRGVTIDKMLHQLGM